MATQAAYGARPVSIDLTRHQALRALRPPRPDDMVELRRSPLRGRDCLDRLGVRQWPPTARIAVCSLSGGVGRTTLASALADLLAGLPYAHIWPPILLLETNPRRSTSPARVEKTLPTAGTCCAPAAPNGRAARVRPSGAHELPLAPGTAPATRQQTRSTLTACGSLHRVTVLDTPPGVPSDLPWVRDDSAPCAVVLVIEPRRRSLDEAADTLVWMNDTGVLPRRRVTVVVNTAGRQVPASSRAAAAALTIRCRSLHAVRKLDSSKRCSFTLARILLDVCDSFPATLPTGLRKDAP